MVSLDNKWTIFIPKYSIDSIQCEVSTLFSILNSQRVYFQGLETVWWRLLAWSSFSSLEKSTRWEFKMLNKVENSHWIESIDYFGDDGCSWQVSSWRVVTSWQILRSWQILVRSWQERSWQNQTSWHGWRGFLLQNLRPSKFQSGVT